MLCCEHAPMHVISAVRLAHQGCLAVAFYNAAAPYMICDLQLQAC